jgi:UDP-glucose 4-epimerase
VRGDAVGAYANVDKAKRLLGWTTQLGIDDGIASALEWARRRDALLGRA